MEVYISSLMMDLGLGLFVLLRSSGKGYLSLVQKRIVAPIDSLMVLLVLIFVYRIFLSLFYNRIKYTLAYSACN